MSNEHFDIESLIARAESGDAGAQFELATLYDEGIQVEKSDTTAFEWYIKAAELEHLEAMFETAKCYREGKGVEPSFEKAFEWSQKLSQFDHAKSMFNVALHYSKGHGVERCYEYAFDWYLKAAELGLGRAMLSVALNYSKGRGVKQSDKEAVEWYSKAADLGEVFAMVKLAMHYSKGYGVEQSEQKSFEWFLKAAQLGEEFSMFSVAICYRDGVGCIKNQNQAEHWFKLAADHGINDAFRYLPHPSLSKYVYPKLEKLEPEKINDIKQAFSDFQDTVIHVMESCEYADDESLYHFTRWPAIESILPKEKSSKQTNVIRLYHEDYMNDPSEGMSLLSLIEEHKYASELTKQAKFMRAVLHKRAELTQDAATYMASFTKSSDRLDLWRAYGSDGDGFCFKIDINKDKNHVWSQAKFDTNVDQLDEDNEEITHSYKLYNVNYKEEKKREYLEKLLSALKPLQEVSSEMGEDVQEEIKKTIFYMLGEVVYLFKDEQYSSEKEVRMFQRLSLNEVCIDETYIGKLYKTTGPILFSGTDSEIIIGPKVASPRAVELSLRKRLQINGFNDTKVTHSTVKYR